MSTELRNLMTAFMPDAILPNCCSYTVCYKLPHQKEKTKQLWVV